MLRIFVILFGIFFIFAGVAGFLPQFTTDNMLFGYFEVNSIHNLMYVVTGVLAIMSATKHNYAKFYLKLFGLIYAILGIIGFVWHGDMGFMLMHMNFADNVLHLGAGVVAMIIGFSAKKKAS